MTSMPAKSVGDINPHVPAFSYAQAAKSSSPALNAYSASNKSASETAESHPKMTSSQQLSEPDDSNQSQSAEKPLAPNEKVNEVLSNGTNGPEKEAQAGADISSASENNVNVTVSDALFSSQSPTTGTTSNPSPFKEEDVSATPNASSESTWDRISQASQTDEKMVPKIEGDEDDSKLSSWEHVPLASQLKEAPMPIVNVWQKRAQDQAKAKDARQASLSSSAAPKPEVAQPHPIRGPDVSTDHSKPDGKRRTKATDEKSGVQGGRDHSRFQDGKFKATDEEKPSFRRTRSPDGAKTVVVAPPPPSDAVSWPTPELAKEGEKKKTQDKTEGAEKDKSSGKTHVKEKWIPIPYVPPVVFSTPMPQSRRGGRPSRGGREGGRGNHAANGNPTDRSASGTQSAATTATSTERSKGENMPPPRHSVSGARPKRAASAGPPTSREQKTSGESSQGRRDDAGTRQFSNGKMLPPDHRRPSATTQPDYGQGGRQPSPPESRRQQSIALNESGGQNAPQDYGYSKGAQDRREFSSRSEYPRDSGNFTRERGEGRPERGRGGYRGRGGHGGFTSGTGNGQNPHPLPPSKSQSYNEARHPSQPQVAPFAGPGREPGRHNRSNSRSQSIPNQPGFGRYPNTGLGGPQHPMNVQTEVANMYYGQPSIMSAMPYTPQMEMLQLQGMVQMQMEYYLSVDNLCKDVFVRKQMDSQGFIFLSVFASFNRIRQLTNDIELLRHVCRMSSQIDFQIGVDNRDRVRPINWSSWVLAMEERDPSAQNDGPSQFLPLYSNYMAQDPGMLSNGMPPMSLNGYSSPPQNGEPFAMNGHDSNGTITDGGVTQTPLSASVPDFQPQQLSLSHFQAPDHAANLENTFSDERVNDLVIVIRNPDSVQGHAKSSAPQPLPNGSMDPKARSDDFSKADGQATVNGDQNLAQDSLRRSRSPHGTSSPAPANSMHLPIFWVKDNEAPVEDLPKHFTHEFYTRFRQDALNTRLTMPIGHCHRDMDILFQFWGHFLIRNFNATMYHEFRYLAVEDARDRDSYVGLRNLVHYYNESALAEKPLSDTLARDYVKLVNSEIGQENRPAFTKLRAAWRNGAFNPKNRARLIKVMDLDLKTLLES